MKIVTLSSDTIDDNENRKLKGTNRDSFRNFEKKTVESIELTTGSDDSLRNSTHRKNSARENRQGRGKDRKQRTTLARATVAKVISFSLLPRFETSLYLDNKDQENNANTTQF